MSVVALGAADDLDYSPDGGLVSFGEFDYVYDSASRLTEVCTSERTDATSTFRSTTGMGCNEIFMQRQ